MEGDCARLSGERKSCDERAQTTNLHKFQAQATATNNNTKHHTRTLTWARLTLFVAVTGYANGR